MTPRDPAETKTWAGARGTAGSFLVRLWAEPREIAGAAPACRASLRDLRTGEQIHVPDPALVGELLLRHLGLWTGPRGQDGEPNGEPDEAPASSQG